MLVCVRRPHVKASVNISAETLHVKLPVERAKQLADEENYVA